MKGYTFQYCAVTNTNSHTGALSSDDPQPNMNTVSPRALDDVLPYPLRKKRKVSEDHASDTTTNTIPAVSSTINTTIKTIDRSHAASLSIPQVGSHKTHKSGVVPNTTENPAKPSLSDEMDVELPTKAVDIDRPT